MDRELVQDYLQQSGMKQEQAQALSRIFVEMATKSDLLVLEQRLESKMEMLRADFKVGLSDLEARLSWRLIGAMIALGSIMTLIDVFVD